MPSGGDIGIQLLQKVEIEYTIKVSISKRIKPSFHFNCLHLTEVVTMSDI